MQFLLYWLLATVLFMLCSVFLTANWFNLQQERVCECDWAKPTGEGERKKCVNVKCSREQGEDTEWQHLGIDCDIVLTFLMDVCNKVTCKWSTRGDMTLYLEKDKTVSEYWAIIAVCKPWINSVSGCIIGYSIPTLVHSSKPGTLRPVANLSECSDCTRPEPNSGARPFPVGWFPPCLGLAQWQ